MEVNNFLKFKDDNNMFVINSSRFASSVPLVPLIAPSGFDPSAQAVNIYSIYNSIQDINKAYIYQFSDTVNTLTLASGGGLSYKYGYTRSGVDYVFDVTSATNPFTAGDTKRWVMGFGTSIVSNPFQAVSNGILWVYMDRVNEFRLGSKNVLKYVHTSDKTSILPTINQAPYAFAGSSGLLGVISIPNYWTFIPLQCFNGCNQITGSISLHSAITYVDFAAFANMSGLNGTITLNEGLLTIGASAFVSCINVVGGLTLPSTVTSIGVQGFANCAKLTGNLIILPTTITFDSNCFYGTNLVLNNAIGGNWEIFDKVLYRDIIRSNIVGATKNKTGALSIPSSVTNIGIGAFLGCTGLNGTLTIPNSVTNIDISAFQSCSGFTSIIIGSSVINISSSVFTGCTAVTSVTLPSGYLLAQTGDNYKFDFSTILTAVSLNDMIIALATATRTITIGATNKARLLAAFPSAETNANARGITIV